MRYRTPGGSVLRTVARLGHAHWFFGNLYEEVVRMPDRLAVEHDLPAAQRLRSPVRYYLPAAPVTVASVVAVALVERRPARTAAALCSTTGAALTGYLVATVIRRLLDDGPSISPGERTELVTRWHRINRVRLLLVAAAAVGLERS